MCQSVATEDASICFECLYSFDLMSCIAMAPTQAEQVAPACASLAPSADDGSAQDAWTSQPSDFEVVVEDQEFGTLAFPFDSGSLHIGRLPTNEIVLNDKTVSRRHLHVFFENGGVWIEDFGSPNPARLNGELVAGRREFRLEDTLQVRGAVIKLVRHQE